MICDSENNMLFNQQVEIVRFKQIATRPHCTNALLNISAVYAWFRDLTLPKEILASEEKFVDAVMQLLDNPLSEKREGRVSPFYEVGITINPKELTPKKKNALRQYAKKENIRKDIGSALEAATFWQIPLYIGKTERLADRVWEHVNRETDLWGRLEEVGLSLQDCLLAYVPISNPDDVDVDLPLEQLVEDIITRLSAPGFVRRSG